MRAILFLALLVAAGSATAQDDLAATWSTGARSLEGMYGVRDTPDSDLGAARGRHRPTACRSTIEAGGDLPVVVRFDSTQATLAGRGTIVVDAVGTFRGSAWDVSNPDAPRRLNVLFRERNLATLDTVWTPGVELEPLLIMASDYDATGATYQGTLLSATPIDCLYALFLTRDGAPGGSGPFELDVRPARVQTVTAVRTDQPTGSATQLTWTYSGAGDAVRVRRAVESRRSGPVIATLPASARAYTDTDYATATQYRYRIEVVDTAGRRLDVSTLGQPARINSSLNLTVRGTLDVGYASDVWGYVGPDGREYALLNSGGLVVIDVTDPTPVQVAHLNGGESDIEAYGHYVYVTGNSGPVQVIDIADPTAPVLIREFWGHPDDPSAGVHTLSIEGNWMYLNGNVAGLSIWSLADPAHPTFLSAYRPAYIHDVHVRNDTLYAAMIGGEGIDIVDVSDPTQPTQIARFNYPGSGAHNICSSANGRYLFVGDEVGTGRWTRVFDVSDPQDVELVAQMIVDPTATVHNCHRKGDLLFLAHYELGARVWNIADPTNPVEVAHYRGGVANGFWTVYPHLPSGRLLASNLGGPGGAQGGLVVLEMDQSVDAEPPPPFETAALRLAPNPTAGTTTAALTLAAPATVRLDVVSVLGRRVASVDAGPLAAGPHRLEVPTAGLAAGVYVVRVTADGVAAGAQTLTVAR